MPTRWPWRRSRAERRPRPASAACRRRRGPRDRSAGSGRTRHRPRPGVLGLVDDAGAHVGRDGLVGEAPHRHDRRAAGHFPQLARDRHREDVAVAAPGARADRLLPRQPVPEAHAVAAGAVDDGALERDEVAHERARARVVVERRAAAARGRVVDERRLLGRDPVGGVVGPVAVLVVADQPDEVRVGGVRERRHPVERERRDVAVGHRRADHAERRVGEALGQRQQFRPVRRSATGRSTPYSCPR